MQEKKLKKKQVSLGSVGGGGEEMFPDAERLTLSKLEGEVIEVLDVKEAEGENGSYYVVLARWESRDGRKISFGTGKATTNQIKTFLEKGGEFPQVVGVVKRRGKGGSYFLFVEPDEL